MTESAGGEHADQKRLARPFYFETNGKAQRTSVLSVNQQLCCCFFLAHTGWVSLFSSSFYFQIQIQVFVLKHQDKSKLKEDMAAG